MLLEKQKPWNFHCPGNLKEKRKPIYFEDNMEKREEQDKKFKDISGTKHLEYPGNINVFGLYYE